MRRRAYSVLTIKAVDPAARVFEGVATTPEVDRSGDIVVPEGARFTLPIKLLYQHNSYEPIGHVTDARVTPEGIVVRGEVATVDEPGRLRDRLTEAWQTLKAGLVDGLSIGFEPIDMEQIPGSWGFKFLTWNWYELSLVTIPANASATITTIKSIVQAWPASRSVAGAGVPAITGKGTQAMATFQEQIKTFEASRAARAARQTELMSAASATGSTLDAAAGEEYDTITAEVKEIDRHLTRLRETDAANVAQAKAVAGTTPAAAAAARAPVSSDPIVRVRDNALPGIGFARLAICRAVAFLSQGATSALEVATARYGDDPRIALAIKAAAPVHAATTLDSAWAGPLAYAQDLASEFLAWLRPQTILGRLPGITMVPFNVRIGQQLSGGAAWWVGQGKPKPLTAFSFGEQKLGLAKIAAISVLAEELVRVSSPSAEQLVRQGLAGAVQEQMDKDFIDPANAGIANVKPESITHSIAGIPSGGNNPDDVRSDLVKLVTPIVDAGLDPAEVVLIMPPALAMVLGAATNALGQAEFPGMSPKGGTLVGYNVVTSQLAKIAGPTGNIVVAAHTPSILLADDGAVTVDASREASLEMSDAPTQDGTLGTGAALVSMWQNNLLALRAERMVNWGKTRPPAVQWLTGVTWGASTTPPAAGDRARK